MTTITVEVTAEDIAGGARYNSLCCPIALAVKRSYPNAHQVLVTPTHVQVQQPGAGFSIESVALPYSAASFISLYDAKMPVEPFSFQLNFR